MGGSDGLRVQGHDRIPEVPELCPDDRSGYVWDHPMDGIGAHQLVRETLWVSAVDIVLAWVTWSVWRAGWPPRRRCVRSALQEVRAPGSPTDGHGECWLWHSFAVHAVVWDSTWFTFQRDMDNLHDSNALLPAWRVGPSWLQFLCPRTDCNSKAPEQSDVLGDDG